MQEAPFYKSHCWVDPVAPFFEIFKIYLFLAQTWPSLDPSNWFFLDLNDWV